MPADTEESFAVVTMVFASTSHYVIAVIDVANNSYLLISSSLNLYLISNRLI